MINLAFDQDTTKESIQTTLADYNGVLEKLSAEQRVKWAMENLSGGFALSSSFGIQSAVMLHMMTQAQPDLPVILTDTGHLFPETYRFVDELTERLNLNLKVYRASESAAWQEARYGQEWLGDESSLDAYNRRNKVEPLERGLSELNVQTWFSGIRRSQSDSRQNMQVLSQLRGRLKVHPIIDWSNKDVHEYLKKYNLPYHPLWEQGYVSVGDMHSSKPLELGMDEQDTRFNGIKRECGLHTDGDGI